VTAPLFLVEPGALAAAGPVLLDGPEGRHAAKVRRLGVGERVDLADGTGLLAECVVASVAGESLTLDVALLRVLPEPAPRFVVVQALPKGDRGELAVEVMTEVGVDEVVPWAASRCVTQWVGTRGERSAARWAAHAREAAKQARRARVPVVAKLASTRDVCALLAGAALGLVLHEAGTEPLAAAEVPEAGDVVLVVGPEGGLDDRELADLTAAGGRVVRLGPEVLRTSTAGVAALAALSVRTARWS
jgi:16S rRNA (uracil1498-N3)-methyltransferase